jgi:KUP system potassium uptake protein
VVATVLHFGSSGALGIAYGVSVTGTMLISAILTLIRRARALAPAAARGVAVALVFLGIDVAFLSANLVKFSRGRVVPARDRRRSPSR